MIEYNVVAKALRDAGGKFQRISEAQVHGLRRRFPGLPEDYVAFLTRVGIGSSPDLDVMLPAEPGSVIGHDAARQLVPYRAVVVAYTDAMYGYRSDWSFGLLSTESIEFVPWDETFSQWIAALVQHL